MLPSEPCGLLYTDCWPRNAACVLIPGTYQCDLVCGERALRMGLIEDFEMRDHPGLSGWRIMQSHVSLSERRQGRCDPGEA